MIERAGDFLTGVLGLGGVMDVTVVVLGTEDEDMVTVEAEMEVVEVKGGDDGGVLLVLLRRRREEGRDDELEVDAKACLIAVDVGMAQRRICGFDSIQMISVSGFGTFSVSVVGLSREI